MTSTPLKLVEFINAPLVGRERHRTVNNALRTMSHLQITLEGDWIVVRDPKLEEEHWMPAMSVVRLVPKDLGNMVDDAFMADDVAEPKPKRGRPRKK